jgi:hypothetical protein
LGDLVHGLIRVFASVRIISTGRDKGATEQEQQHREEFHDEVRYRRHG